MQRTGGSAAERALARRLTLWARATRVGGETARFFKLYPLGTAGAFLLLVMVIMAIFAPVIAPYNPLKTNAFNLFDAPSRTHWLGTDEIGRDVLSRVIYGSRISIYVGLVAVSLGVTIGTTVGLISGYFGGKVDIVLQRIVDAVMGFPTLLLLITVAAVLGPGITKVMLALGVVLAPGTSRVVRGTVLSVKENQYVEAARALGATHSRIILIHILPNVFAAIIVLATVQLGGAIIAEASLSFLGLGTPPPTPSWGGMLAGQGRLQATTYPWIALSSGIALSLAVLGFNLFGDALRDRFDPRLRGSR